MVSALFSRKIKWPSTYFKALYKFSHRVIKKCDENVASKYELPRNLDVLPYSKCLITVSIGPRVIIKTEVTI